MVLQGGGGEPLLVRHAYGKGRVTVFSGTVLGEPPAGMEAFWETPEWVSDLASTIRWLGGP